jgi:hypothetical protein
MRTIATGQVRQRAFLPHRRHRHLRLEVGILLLACNRRRKPLAQRPLEGQVPLSATCPVSLDHLSVGNYREFVETRRKLTPTTRERVKSTCAVRNNLPPALLSCGPELNARIPAADPA